MGQESNRGSGGDVLDVERRGAGSSVAIPALTSQGGRMREPRRSGFVDEIVLNTIPEVRVIGGATDLATVAFLAATARVASSWMSDRAQEGDQIEWKATLSGRITVTKQILDAALNKLMD
jgi:hypothetical protein